MLLWKCYAERMLALFTKRMSSSLSTGKSASTTPIIKTDTTIASGAGRNS